MKHLGDISKINGAEIEPVDIITFGSPCQDLSVAGKRAGLGGARSGLFMEAVRIIREMREATNGQYPTFALWENVPGAFSSNKGEDFRIVLEELIKITEPSAAMPEVPPFGWAYADSYSGNGWSLAYRVFDAQYWGVPQRRRRIHLVADFRGQRARKVLFEREGLRGHLTESPPPRERITVYVEGGAGAADQVMTQQTGIIDSIGGQAERGWEGDIAPTLKASHYKFPPVITQSAGFCTEHSAKAHSVGYQEEMSPTLRAGVTPAIITKAWDARGNGTGDTVSTITGDHENRVTDYTTVICLQGDGINRDAKQSESGFSEDVGFKTYQKVTGPLMANSHPGSYTGQDAYSDMLVAGVDCRNMNEYPELYPTLQAKPNGGQSLNFSGAVRDQYIVRRLTPTECARLQGFSDKWGHPDQKDEFSDAEYSFWLDVRNTHAAINGKAVKEYTKDQMLKWYNKLHSDSAEYKMWGNGIALPPALYCMQGMTEALEESHSS